MKSVGKIRIIAGQWRRRMLPVLDSPDLRPSPDRVRETLFNWIGDNICDSVCLDLFAGTGALGIESASRGAAKVWVVERDYKLCIHLREQCQLLGAQQIQVVCADALTWIASASESADYIFLDPPFGNYVFKDLLAGLESSRLLKPSTVLYYECNAGTGRRLDLDYPCGQTVEPGSWWRSHSAQAGRVSYNLFQRQG